MISSSAAPTRTLLADGPVVDVGALDDDVLADRAGLEAERVEMLLRREQHLAPWWIAVGALLEALARDRQHAPARLRTAASALRRDEEPGDGCHAPRLSIESEPP